MPKSPLIYPYQVYSDELIQPVGERLKRCQLAGIDHGGHLLGDRLIVNGFSRVPSLKSFWGSYLTNLYDLYQAVKRNVWNIVGVLYPQAATHPV